MNNSRFGQSVAANAAKRVAATVAAAAALGAGVAVAFAGPASAAPDSSGNPLKVCAEGTYDAYVVLPDQGGLAGANVKSGTCHTFHFGNSNEVEDIEVRGFIAPQTPHDSPTEFHVATGKWQSGEGGTVTALGTVEHHTAHFPVLSSQ